MFKFANDVDLNKISLTGVRGIVLLGLLSLKPRTFKELKKAFIDYQLMNESNSDDILRLDIKTLRHAGCEIINTSKKGGNYYVLKKHPFGLELDEKEIKNIKRIYNKTKSELDILKLLDFDDFLIKLANFVQDEEAKEQVLGISELRHYDKQLLRDIYFDCEQKYQIKLLYNRPSTNLKVYKNIYAQKLVYQNNKIYLYGYDVDIKKFTILNFKRIKEVIARTFGKGEKETNLIKVRFYLRNDFIDSLDDNEVIVETIGDTYLVEAIYYNEFLATQRILSFGINCKVIEPEDFKDRIISKIKEMKEVYGD